MPMLVDRMPTRCLSLLPMLSSSFAEFGLHKSRRRASAAQLVTSCPRRALRPPYPTDQPVLRTEVRRRGIAVRIVRKGIETSKRLGRHRWIVEACLS
jgi:hypothetical protein